ncbi:unnamed protein product [Didymodactylos carnosus]|nr:unnamed protein product [Didymodactylos carnosus]CAF4269451.1 unnamed protein product [Didymodactylos carnosus]
MFFFRYGNLVIDNKRSFARIGLIHMIIANFCTWFEAIVKEAIDETARYTSHLDPTSLICETMTTTSVTAIFLTTESLNNIVTSTQESAATLIQNLESDVGVYLYPCLIEYSLISLTVFYIMFQNIGRRNKKAMLRFGDRHVYMVNCSKASRGLVFGGIAILLSILSLIPFYLLNDAQLYISQITELTLLCLSLITVIISFRWTMKLKFDSNAHVDVFDEVLILITTFGAFTYAFFSIFAAIFLKIECEKHSESLRQIDLTVSFVSVAQILLQSAFLKDALRRRSESREHLKKKPGREMITALLMLNFSMWLHDSLSAKKAELNPLQVEYFTPNTWSLIQAFTSPLTIFYRFHSSVCLADIWAISYKDDSIKPTTHSFLDYMH